MIRRPLVFCTAAFALALAACDGGGGDSDPTPTPTPTPTPSPTASPTYAALPPAAATEFFSVTATTNYTGDLATGPVTLGAAVTEARSDRVRLAVSNVLATGTWVVREATEESRYTTTNNTVAPAVGVTEYVFRTDDTATAGKFTQAEFLNNTVTSAVTTDAFFSTLTRISYASWIRGDSTTGQKRIAYTTWGFPTAFGDLPTTGSATYTARIVGRAVQVVAAGTGTMVRVGGTATINVNFGTGLVTTTLNVTTVGAGGAETPYGTFTGSGGIALSSNQFSGSFAAASPVPGTFQGGFYGSQGEEIAITFAGIGAVGAVDTRLVGVVVANKN
jgi:hypothetical protein